MSPKARAAHIERELRKCRQNIAKLLVLVERGRLYAHRGDPSFAAFVARVLPEVEAGRASAPPAAGATPLPAPEKPELPPEPAEEAVAGALFGEGSSVPAIAQASPAAPEASTLADHDAPVPPKKKPLGHLGRELGRLAAAALVATFAAAGGASLGLSWGQRHGHGSTGAHGDEAPTAPAASHGEPHVAGSDGHPAHTSPHSEPQAKAAAHAPAPPSPHDTASSPDPHAASPHLDAPHIVPAHVETPHGEAVHTAAPTPHDHPHPGDAPHPHAHGGSAHHDAPAPARPGAEKPRPADIASEVRALAEVATKLRAPAHTPTPEPAVAAADHGHAGTAAPHH